ncbi:MAG TPA: zf-HC2 domain-containing protein [Gaiellaceae bacterium]|nr:zf-HC2 domain-containing protein [Gaiellaceae bacterium]
MAGRPPTRGTACDRPREWVSLRVDGELSLLEEELLERHLSGCAACREFEDDLRSTTELLRATPLEAPSRRVSVPAPAESERTRRPVGGRRTALAAAAALAVGAVLGATLERPSNVQPSERGPEVSLLSNDFEELRELPRTKRLLVPGPEQVTPPNPPEGVI